ncbi:hypothetical protein M9458_036356, partial [Cirrhinus mrigala]
AALEGSDCPACEDLPIRTRLRARLAVVRNGGLSDSVSPSPAASEPWAKRTQTAPSGGFADELPSAQCPCSHCAPEPDDSFHPSPEAQKLVSFGAEEDDIKSTSASDPGAWLEALTEGPSPTPASLDEELLNILTEAVEDMGLDWVVPEQPAKQWMDGSFLGAGRQSDALQRPAPFFPELHEELTSSWCSSYSARAHAQGTPLLTTVEGGVKTGLRAIACVRPAVGKPPRCLPSHVEQQLTLLRRHTSLCDMQHLPSEQLFVLRAPKRVAHCQNRGYRTGLWKRFAWLMVPKDSSAQWECVPTQPGVWHQRGRGSK